MSGIDQSVMRGVLEDWLNQPENLKKFDTLFSTVLINNMGKESEEFKWLRATSMSYAYTDKNSEESSIFGVLAMT
ncbi:TULIP family P47-like protein, partial [Paraburkholderia sp. SIMBA_055]